MTFDQVPPHSATTEKTIRKDRRDWMDRKGKGERKKALDVTPVSRDANYTFVATSVHLNVMLSLSSLSRFPRGIFNIVILSIKKLVV